MNINEILENHKRWLNGKDGGVRADFSGADFSGADFSGADLRRADLSDANFSWAKFSGAKFSGADFSGANLHRANLYGADFSAADFSDTDFSGANLHRANLYGANLYGAKLYRAKLYGANFSEANLSGANFSDANFSDANLSGAKNLDKAITNVYTSFYHLQCPEIGSYIGYKKANNLIVTLKITENSYRSSATSRKCRASEAVVIAITNIDNSENFESVPSDYDGSFIYKLGETVKVDDFNMDRWDDCTAGIHHFITRKEAVDYK